VLDRYFNLAYKFNLIDRLQYDLIRFFDHLVVANSFGATCKYRMAQKVSHHQFLKNLIKDCQQDYISS